jgi:outer membrane protein OmpA-like peptidoglycan-associated protein
MYNKNLSEARALDITDAIKLAVPGLVPSFLAPMGYGETRLKVPTADNKKESRNRRVEIQFIKL